VDLVASLLESHTCVKIYLPVHATVRGQVVGWILCDLPSKPFLNPFVVVREFARVPVLLFDNEPLSFLNRERISTPLFVRNGRTEKVTLASIQTSV
jgi:hypothetical protein